jgi:RND superfamily putative drug exporter
MTATISPPRPDRSHRLLATLYRHRRTALLTMVLGVLVAGALGLAGMGRLRPGGYVATTGESARAQHWLTTTFSAGSPELQLLARLPTRARIDDPASTAAGRDLTARIAARPGVAAVHSYWSDGDPALVSADRKASLIDIQLSGADTATAATTRRLVREFTPSAGPFSIAAAGPAEAGAELITESRGDAARADLAAVPLTLLVLLLAFGTVRAALVPLMVGVAAMSGTLLLLVLLSYVTAVSIMAVNLTTILGLGLAVDYSLLLITRCRRELARGLPIEAAVQATIRSAGRTVACSAAIAAVALSALLLFPLYALRSMAYAAISVVLLAALTALALTPLLLVFSGVSATSERRLRLPWMPIGSPRSPCGSAARPSAGHPALVAAGGTLILLLLALPVLGLRFGLGDDRVLAPDAPAHLTAQTIRTTFPEHGADPVRVALPGASDGPALAAYTSRLSLVPGVLAADGAAGRYVRGRQTAAVRRPATFTGPAGGWIRLTHATDPNSAAGERLIRRVRAVPAPTPALVTGGAATLVDTTGQIFPRLPAALFIVAGGSGLLLAAATRSLLIPAKFLLLSTLSLLATAGLVTAVFQDGILGPLAGSFTRSGHLELTVPIIMFCVVFGLSLDYEIFLLAGIREHYLATGDNAAAVTEGVRTTARLIITAAAVLACPLAALGSSHVAPIKLFGLGTAAAILLDAALVRAVLMPALMRLAGRANWWAPPPLRARRPTRHHPREEPP